MRNRARTPSTLLALALLAAGCGRSPPPRLDWDAPSDQRASDLEAHAAAGRREMLWRAAGHDPDPMVRGRALELLLPGVDPEDPDALPPGGLLMLERRMTEDPDTTRRFAALVLLRLRGERALDSLARVHAESRSPTTRRQLEEALAEAVEPHVLLKYESDYRPAVVSLVKAATRRRAGAVVDTGLPFVPARRRKDWNLAPAPAPPRRPLPTPLPTRDPTRYRAVHRRLR